MKKILFSALIISIFSCKSTTEEPIPNEYLNLPANPFDYSSTNLPSNLLAELKLRDNTPSDNQISNHTATLGRVLFYDKNLSINNTISCASCHKQTLSFSDTTQFSQGFEGKLTSKHTMRLINIRFFEQKTMFWDNRAASLEHQVTQPISNSIEMGLSLKSAIAKISKLPYYPTLFKNAFGNETIDSVRITKALAQFVRSIVTTNSKYDLVKAGKDKYTASEARGDSLFFNIPVQNGIFCNNCHTAPAFFPVNNVISRNSKLNAQFKTVESELGNFKFGTLRNTGNMLRFLHDGSYRTLDDLFSGDVLFHSIPAKQDRQDLINFIKTLDDHSLATEVKFSNPFKK